MFTDAKTNDLMKFVETTLFWFHFNIKFVENY
jgi:hypothetical protein